MLVMCCLWNSSFLTYLQRECDILIEVSNKYCIIWTHVFKWYVVKYRSKNYTKMIFSVTNTNCLAQY